MEPLVFRFGELHHQQQVLQGRPVGNREQGAGPHPVLRLCFPRKHQQMAGLGPVLVHWRAKKHLERVFLGEAPVLLHQKGRAETEPVSEKVLQAQRLVQETPLH